MDALQIYATSMCVCVRLLCLPVEQNQMDEWIRAINQQLRLDGNGMDTASSLPWINIVTSGSAEWNIENILRTRSTHSFTNDLIDFETIELQSFNCICGNQKWIAGIFIDELHKYFARIFVGIVFELLEIEKFLCLNVNK